jgi:hypothetical protein
VAKRELPRRLRLPTSFARPKPTLPVSPPAHPKQLRIPVPFIQGKPIGLGDVIKRATTAVGIKPCGGCRRRAAALNQRVVFGRNK